MIKENSNNLTLSIGKVKYEDRCKLLNQKGLVIWFTGISGSGKSTIAIEVENELMRSGFLTYRLDGDNIRYGLSSDLRFSEEERNENIRRIVEVAALFKDVGIITLVSCISPYKKMREEARGKIGEDSFIETYVKADIDTCIERDPKNLYQMVFKGVINNFTGITLPYEEPQNPELTLDTTILTVNESKNLVLKYIYEALIL